MKKRFLAIFLAMVMCLALLPTAALAVGEEDSYFENSFFQIGNSDYEPWENWRREDQGWSYDAATRTITLTNYLGPLSSNLIYEPLYIVLNGENTAGYMNGIPGTFAIENSVIRGDGTLNCGNLFVCIKGNNGGERLAGLAVESGTLNCDIGKQPEISSNNYVEWGLAKLTVSGGTLHIHGGEGGLNGTMFGEKNLFSVTETGTLILEGSKYAIELTDNADRYGAIISGLESATAVDRDGKPLHWKNTVETIQYPSGVSAKVHAARLYNADGSIATYAKITAGTPTTPDKPDSSTAYASTQNVLVDGKAVEFQAYALKDQSGNDTNYVKLRDVAYALNGTAAQFSVGWDQAAKSISVTSGEAYESKGSEMKTPYSGDRTYTASTSPLYINGKAADLGAILLTDDAGNGYTYYKLRDLGQLLNFNVTWNGRVVVESDKPYTG